MAPRAMGAMAGPLMPGGGPGLAGQPTQQLKGTTAEIGFSPDPPVVGDNTITLSLRDLSQQPVDKATVTWSLSLTGRSQVLASGTARMAAAGDYRLPLRLAAPGQYQLGFRVRRSGMPDELVYYRFTTAPQS